jgi:hypothetical protein
MGAGPGKRLGGKPDKLWRDALSVAIKRAGKDDPRPYLARIAEKCVEKAMEGDLAAIKEIGDRLDGKPAQQLVHEGGDEPMKIVAVWGAANASADPEPKISEGDGA